MSQYKELGTSATKVELHTALKESGLKESSNYFAQLLPDFAGNEEFSSFIHSDGAGTKSIVAYLVYRESSDPSVFRGIAQDALVMNLDDLFCLGECESLMLSNAVARNAKTIGSEALTELFKGYLECVEKLSELGIQIALGGGETADVGDIVRTLLVDATLCGRIQKRQLIDLTRIKHGDAIVGLASFGQSTYENSVNSGIGSNGLTLARHALLKSDYQNKYREIVPLEDESRIKSLGRYSLSDGPPGLKMDISQALLSPTRTYAPILKQIYREISNQIHGVIHNTGGGLSKVIRFGKGNRYVKDHLFTTPELFKLIQTEGKVSFQEMCQVFNMGHRLELYVPETLVDQVIAISRSFAVDAQRIGTVESTRDPSFNEVVVSYNNELAQFKHCL